MPFGVARSSSSEMLLSDASIEAYVGLEGNAKTTGLDFSHKNRHRLEESTRLQHKQRATSDVKQNDAIEQHFPQCIASRYQARVFGIYGLGIKVSLHPSCVLS